MFNFRIIFHDGHIYSIHIAQNQSKKLDGFNFYHDIMQDGWYIWIGDFFSLYFYPIASLGGTNLTPISRHEIFYKKNIHKYKVPSTYVRGFS